MSVPELLAEMGATEGAASALSKAEVSDLHRQWAAIKAGEPTVPHDDVMRWLDTWGTPRFKAWKDQ